MAALPAHTGRLSLVPVPQVSVRDDLRAVSDALPVDVIVVLMRVSLWRDRDPLGPYQEHHIAVRHGVTAELFEAVRIERIDLIVRQDGSYESVGAADDGREVYLVWRWDVFDPERVFPITAYFLPDEG